MSFDEVTKRVKPDLRKGKIEVFRVLEPQ